MDFFHGWTQMNTDIWAFLSLCNHFKTFTQYNYSLLICVYLCSSVENIFSLA